LPLWLCYEQEIMKKNRFFRFVVIYFSALSGLSFSEAALFSLSGNHRFGTNLFFNLDSKKGVNTGAAYDKASDTSAFIEHRLLIRPDVLIDERFSIHSEWSLLSQGGTVKETNFNTSNNSNQVNGGSAFGPVSSQLFALRYGYLKWVSDVGVFKAGRMPKGWGLGLMFDEGAKAEDEGSTIVDRVGFEGQLGSLVLNAGYEKREEGYLHTDADDEEVYEGSVKYDNEGSGVSIGLLFGRHVRGAFSSSAATYKSSYDYSFYAKKEWEKSSIAAEFASNSYDKQAHVFGALTQYRYHPGNWDLEVDGLFSSHSGDRAFIVHPNYRPFLILFRQVQGSNFAKKDNPTRLSSGIGIDPSDVASKEKGALLGRFGAFYSFAQKKYRLGVVGGYAKLMSANDNGSSLGFETDLHFEQKWYENFKTSLAAGIFLPGNAFAAEKQSSWGVQVRSYLNF
jgi:hypothetical protein